MMLQSNDDGGEGGTVVMRLATVLDWQAVELFRLERPRSSVAAVSCPHPRFLSAIPPKSRSYAGSSAPTNLLLSRSGNLMTSSQCHAHLLSWPCDNLLAIENLLILLVKSQHA